MSIDDQTPWVRDYRGLWGLDTRDRFGGERAPSGPRYERDGTVRTSWANPLGWAGLQKVSPHDDDFANALADRVAALERQVNDLDATIVADREVLRVSAPSHVHCEPTNTRGTWQRNATPRSPGRKRPSIKRSRFAPPSQKSVAPTWRRSPSRSRQNPLSRTSSAHTSRAHRVSGAPHAVPRDWQRSATPLLLASTALLLIVSPLAFLTTIVVLVLLFTGVEAIARRRLLSFLASTALVLVVVVASVAVILLFLTHWRIAVSLLVGSASLMLLVGNLRDQRRR